MKYSEGHPFVFGYVDDILVFSENSGKHLKCLGTMFDRL